MAIIYPKIKWFWRFLIALVISSIMMTMIWVFSSFREPPKIDFLFTALLVLMSYACLETVRFIQLFISKLPFFKSNILNNAFSLIASVITGTITYVILFYLFKWLDYFVKHSEPPLFKHLISATLIGLVMSIIFALIQFAIGWKHQYYSSFVQNEEFKKEIATANLSILKNQLDPHFMFNNFNTLYYLIDEDSGLAKKFLENISTIYRYILQNRDKQLISIIEEYEITKQYLEVLQQRYSNSLEIEDTILLPHIEGKKVPPLVLQQLIENAIKHNRIDKSSRLYIKISSENSYFTIKNNINPKRTEVTQKTGLKNIEKRYLFFTDEKVIIIKNDNEFSVSVPLI